jgi:hypothetical protein
MTPQQAIDYLVDRVGHERANAEAEVRRSFLGTYPPLETDEKVGVGGANDGSVPTTLLEVNVSLRISSDRHPIAGGRPAARARVVPAFPTSMERC